MLKLKELKDLRFKVDDDDNADNREQLLQIIQKKIESLFQSKGSESNPKLKIFQSLFCFDENIIQDIKLNADMNSFVKVERDLAYLADGCNIFPQFFVMEFDNENGKQDKFLVLNETIKSNLEYFMKSIEGETIFNLFPDDVVKDIIDTLFQIVMGAGALSQVNLSRVKKESEETEPVKVESQPEVVEDDLDLFAKEYCELRLADAEITEIMESTGPVEFGGEGSCPYDVQAKFINQSIFFESHDGIIRDLNVNRFVTKEDLNPATYEEYVSLVEMINPMYDMNSISHYNPNVREITENLHKFNQISDLVGKYKDIVSVMDDDYKNNITLFEEFEFDYTKPMGKEIEYPLTKTHTMLSEPKSKHELDEEDGAIAVIDLVKPKHTPVNDYKTKVITLADDISATSKELIMKVTSARYDKEACDRIYKILIGMKVLYKNLLDGLLTMDFGLNKTSTAEILNNRLKVDEFIADDANPMDVSESIDSLFESERGDLVGSGFNPNDKGSVYGLTPMDTTYKTESIFKQSVPDFITTIRLIGELYSKSIQLFRRNYESKSKDTGDGLKLGGYNPIIRKADDAVDTFLDNFFPGLFTSSYGDGAMGTTKRLKISEVVVEKIINNMTLLQEAKNLLSHEEDFLLCLEKTFDNYFDYQLSDKNGSIPISFVIDLDQSNRVLTKFYFEITAKIITLVPNIDNGAKILNSTSSSYGVDDLYGKEMGLIDFSSSPTRKEDIDRIHEQTLDILRRIEANDLRNDNVFTEMDVENVSSHFNTLSILIQNEIIDTLQMIGGFDQLFAGHISPSMGYNLTSQTFAYKMNNKVILMAQLINSMIITGNNLSQDTNYGQNIFIELYTGRYIDNKNLWASIFNNEFDTSSLPYKGTDPIINLYKTFLLLRFKGHNGILLAEKNNMYNMKKYYNNMSAFLVKMMIDMYMELHDSNSFNRRIYMEA